MRRGTIGIGKKMKKKKCRICYWGKETIEHLSGICAGMEETRADRRLLLREDGIGLKWMIEVLRKRKRWEKDN